MSKIIIFVFAIFKKHRLCQNRFPDHLIFRFKIRTINRVDSNGVVIRKVIEGFEFVIIVTATATAVAVAVGVAASVAKFDDIAP